MYGAKWVHGHDTPEAHEAAHHVELREKHQRYPGRYQASEPHTVTTPMTAYVNYGRWLVDCPCGNGVAVETGWPGRCFSCGAVYPTVQYPRDRVEVERVLRVRPDVHRHWRASEHVIDLQRENREHGLVDVVSEISEVAR